MVGLRRMWFGRIENPAGVEVGVVGIKEPPVDAPQKVCRLLFERGEVIFRERIE